MLPTDSLFPNFSSDPGLSAAFTAQAEGDLMHFLRLRAEETVRGGSLVAHLPIVVSTDAELSNRSWDMHIMTEAIRVWWGGVPGWCVCVVQVCVCVEEEE